MTIPDGNNNAALESEIFGQGCKKIFLGALVFLTALPMLVAFSWLVLLSPGAVVVLFHEESTLLDRFMWFWVLVYPLLAVTGFILTTQGFKNREIKRAVSGVLISYSYLLFRLIYFSAV